MRTVARRIHGVPEREVGSMLSIPSSTIDRGHNVDDSIRNNPSGYNAPIAPPESLELPELPDGWRYAETGPWEDQRSASPWRVRVLPAALVSLILALVIGVFVWNGAAHYTRGVQALKTKDYARAALEFSDARVLGFPYRDAPSLEQEARRAETTAYEASLKQARARSLLTQLDTASARLKAGDASGVLTTLRAIDAAALLTAREGDETVRTSADALVQDLAAASRSALGSGAWNRAGRLAAALLVLDPSSQPAATLAAKAQTGQGLSAKLGKAKDAARRGKWRAALRLSLAILVAQKDFPGAQAVVADARRALAPKPKPAVTPPNPSTQTTGGSSSTTSPQPPPP